MLTRFYKFLFNFCFKYLTKLYNFLSKYFINLKENNRYFRNFCYFVFEPLEFRFNYYKHHTKHFFKRHFRRLKKKYITQKTKPTVDKIINFINKYW